MRGFTALLRLIWRSSGRHTAGYAALTLLQAAAPVASVRATQLLLDALPPGSPSRHLLARYATVLILAGVVAAVAPQVSRYVEGGLRREVTLSVYDGMYRAVNRLNGLRRFETPEYLDRVRLAQQGAQSVPGRAASAVFGCVLSAVSAAGFLGTLLSVDPMLAAIVLLAALPAAAAHRLLGARRSRMQWRNSAGLRRQMFYSSLLTDLNAAKEVRLFGLGDFLRGRMLSETRATQQREAAVDRTILRAELALGALGAVITTGGLVWAVHAAASGRISVGTIAMLLLSIVAVQNALGGIAVRIADLTEALGLFGHYLALVEAGPDLPVPEQPRALSPLSRGIELRDVWFRYQPDGPWILRGVDLVIPPGRTLALVGLNGAGKSTLIKLLCRLYDPERGSITWDGVDLRETDPAELRRRIGTVFQDYMVYDLPASENIGMGDLPALEDRERVEAAAELAGIAPVLSALPYGYDTMLSRIFFDDASKSDARTGVALSGGQWQRVALARGFMRDRADVLILDEPSSGLDAEAEHDVHTRLLRHRSGRTTVLVSHRLGAVRAADTIVVLEDGVVAETGSHAELVAADGRYARLFALQSSGYREAEPSGAAS